VPNPGVSTLAIIRSAAKSRADMVNSSFVTDPEWLEFINGSYTELYDLLIQKFGSDYYVATPYQFTTDGINDQYALPATDPAFYKLLGVEVQLDSKTWSDVPRFNFADRNKGSYPPSSQSTSLRYKLLGSKLWLRSGRVVPGAGLVIQVWYAPRLLALVSDTDVVDGVSGWEEYIKVDAAIKALAKEESDTTQLERAKAALLQRIESAAENRDAGSPSTVADVRGDDGMFPDVGWF
jgi:hypothetical protein